jgi:hypothetical protein
MRRILTPSCADASRRSVCTEDVVMRKYSLLMLLILLMAGCSAAKADLAQDELSAQTPTAAAAVEESLGSSAQAGAVPTEPAPLPAVPEAVLPPGVISGVVRDAEGPVADAVVRVRLTEHSTVTAPDGAFTLTALTMTQPVSVTAWAEGYYVGWTNGTPGSVPITVTLKPHYTTDNLEHDWFEFEGVGGSASCAPCHPSYDEWQRDAHSQAAVNPRFLTMYEGTDVQGNKSPSNYDAAGRIQPPDLSQPYYGPGYRLDYRDRAGNCAACHTPLADNLEPSNTCGWSGCHTEFTAWAAKEVPSGIYPTDLTGDAADGIACDFCHKIGEVHLDPETQLPYADRPGISSMRLYRPTEGNELFFGTHDDVTRRVSYLPLLEESAYCAPCHYGVFGAVVGHKEVYGGVEVYNSYGEWLESPYSDPETGQTCQECHMPALEQDYFVYPEAGGLHRTYKPPHDHYMPGASDVNLLQNSVTMTATAQWEGNQVSVQVDITNDKTGHHVPTGTPLRHMILVVSASDAGGRTLPYATGPVLPGWAGNYAGQAGKAFAKILEDLWTGDVPTASYWRDIRLVEDTRLAAFETDVTRYGFDAPDQGEVTVQIRLWYRRAFQQLMEWKGWEDADILMEEATITLPGRD